jgi:hypothetical protein
MERRIPEPYKGENNDERRGWNFCR